MLGGLQLWRTDGYRARLEGPLACPTPVPQGRDAFASRPAFVWAQRNSRIALVSFAKLAHNGVSRRSSQGESSLSHRQQPRYRNVLNSFEGSGLLRSEQIRSSEARAPGKLGSTKFSLRSPDGFPPSGTKAWYPTDRNPGAMLHNTSPGLIIGPRDLVPTQRPDWRAAENPIQGFDGWKRLHRSMLPSVP